MSKAIGLALIILMFTAGVVFADSEHKERYEEFDWGVYLNVVLWEDDHIEVGTLTTFDYESDELRTYAGAKINLWKLLSKDD